MPPSISYFDDLFGDDMASDNKTNDNESSDIGRTVGWEAAQDVQDKLVRGAESAMRLKTNRRQETTFLMDFEQGAIYAFSSV